MLKANIRALVAEQLDLEASKEQEEAGIGTSIEYVRDDPDDPTSAVIAWRITVVTNDKRGVRGLEHRFPDVPADREPTDEEIQAIVNDYGVELVDAIKARRSERKARK